MYNFLSKQGLEAMIGIIENRIAGIGFTLPKLNFPNLIATKIYKCYMKRKETLEINSSLINLIFIFKILFSNFFNKMLRFFN